jgi:hypothetical protein
VPKGVTVFAEDFDPVAKLAGEDCPRCMGRGLVPATHEDCYNVKPEDVAQEWYIVCPSITAKCPECGLVGSWPAMSMEPPAPPKHKRLRKEARAGV